MAMEGDGGHVAVSEEVAVQPALPELDLPEYAGRKPSGMKTRVSGAGNRVYRPHTIGDRVVLVIEATVSDAGHKQTRKEGLVYTEKFEVADVFEVDVETGDHLLLGLRTAYRLADDERHGRARLPLETLAPVLGPDGWTDASGRVLLPEELAEIRGELALKDADSEPFGDDGDEDGDGDGDREAYEVLEAARGRTVGEPWPGYEVSSATTVVGHVRQMDDRDEVLAAMGWEEEHGARSSILKACGKRAAELMDGGE